MTAKLLRLEGPAVRDVIETSVDRREDRRERLRIALAMIGGGLLEVRERRTAGGGMNGGGEKYGREVR